MVTIAVLVVLSAGDDLIPLLYLTQALNAVHGSEGSHTAIPVAAELARRDGARLVIEHVEQDIVGKGGGPIIATEVRSRPTSASGPRGSPRAGSRRASRCAM